MVTKREIGTWFDQGKKEGARYMLVICDTFSYEDYPAFIGADDDVNARIKQVRRSPMQRLMEVYDLSMSKTEQLKAARVFNFPKPTGPDVPSP